MDSSLAGIIGVYSSGYGSESPLPALLAFIIFIVVLRWTPRVLDSFAQVFSGEQRSLMPRGFLRHSTRIRRTIELQAVVSRLALITRMNLPLAPALDAAAVGERGRIRDALQGIAGRIRDGVPVSAALETAFRGCPPQLIATLRRAESCGQLAGALHQQERMMDSMIELHFKTTAHTRHAVTYGLVMMLFCGVMVFGVVIFLIPKFKEIFRDFDVCLPGVTMALLNVADWVYVHIWGILIGLALMIVAMTLMLTSTRRTKGTNTLKRIVASVRWRFPITRSLDYGLGMAKAMRSMMLGIRNGTPNAFGEGLSSVVSGTNHLRTRLDLFTQSVSQGTAPHQAAQDANLGEICVSALRMVERGQDPERTLGHAADYYETIAYRWWHALAAISGPLVTLATGIMVGFVALALFMPLIALIDSVSGTF